MSASAALPDPESLHPSLWRASQLARSNARCLDTGYPALSSQLPGAGWPLGNMVELLAQQPGIGELRLVAPALAKVADRMVAFLQPPHAPQIIALAALGVPPASVHWLRADRTGDALWAADQVLRSGCGALLLWQSQIRADSLRRLQLAAHEGETLFFLMRPLAAAQDASPSPLRLALRPTVGGVEIEFVKRRGPVKDDRLIIPLQPSVVSRPAPHERPVPAKAHLRIPSVQMAE